MRFFDGSIYMMNRLAVALCIVALLGFAGQVGAKTAEGGVKALVAQLNADAFAKREAAMVALEKLGNRRSRRCVRCWRAIRSRKWRGGGLSCWH